MNNRFSCPPICFIALDSLTTSLQASIEYQKCERERLEKVNTSLRRFCEFERSSINIRSRLLEELERATLEVDAEQDLHLYIAQEQAADDTHKYAKALSLLDWHFEQR